MSDSLLETIEAELLEDREEGLLHGEVVANEVAVKACQNVGSVVYAQLKPPNKWAAFGEDGGGVTLVIWSPNTDRRVDFRISQDGTQVVVIRTWLLDEHLEVSSDSLRADEWQVLSGHAKWVSERPRQRVGG